NVVAVKFRASVEKHQLDDESRAEHDTAQLLDQLRGSPGRSARCEKVVHNQYLRTFADGVPVNFECVSSVLEFVRDARAFSRKLLRLSHRDKSRTQSIGKRRREDKP